MPSAAKPDARLCVRDAMVAVAVKEDLDRVVLALVDSAAAVHVVVAALAAVRWAAVCSKVKEWKSEKQRELRSKSVKG